MMRLGWRCLALGVFFTLGARADLYITVQGAHVEKAKLAVGKIHNIPGAIEVSPSFANQVRAQIKLDLEFADLFNFVDESATQDLDAPPNSELETAPLNYEGWSKKGAGFVLRMAHKIEMGKLILDAYLYHVPGTKRVIGNRYQIPLNQTSRMVHAVAEDILKELTGERGLFFSRVLMVCWDPHRSNPAKYVYVVDSDGKNAKRLTTDDTLTLSPAWVRDGKHISYTQYAWRKNPDTGVTEKGTVLRIHDLISGRRVILSDQNGMNSGASWSPNGSRAALTLSFTGRPELYLIAPDRPNQPEPLSRSIRWKKIGSDTFQPTNPKLLLDVEPSWSPDGGKIAFSSARTMSPMIYIVELSTRIASQLTFAGTYNASPAWSPKGDTIVFAAQRVPNGSFDLFRIGPDGNNLQQLTNGENSRPKVSTENPSWAPTGRHFVAASNSTGRFSVYAMTVEGAFKTDGSLKNWSERIADGSAKRISPANLECKTPAWGPPEG